MSLRSSSESQRVGRHGKGVKKEVTENLLTVTSLKAYFVPTGVIVIVRQVLTCSHHSVHLENQNL